MTIEDITLADFPLQSSKGEIQLSQFNNAWLVIYFYPKDSTPGCTTQATEFSQFIDKFSALDTHIIGVSRDSLKSHERFIEKQNIAFTLVSDTDEKLCRHFDVIKQKNMYGKQVMGIERSSFIFYQGQLVDSYRKVKAAGHAEFILNEIKRLKAEF